MARAAVWKTRADCDRVWEVLADGWSFPGWVVGAARVRAVDADWPDPGTRIHHSVGLWPGLLHDSTEVVRSVPRSELVLHARAWPFGVAEILLRLTERDGRADRHVDPGGAQRAHEAHDHPVGCGVAGGGGLRHGRGPPRRPGRARRPGPAPGPPGT